jgi:hypothetical protein
LSTVQLCTWNLNKLWRSNSLFNLWISGTYRHFLKGIVRPFEFGGVPSFIRSGIINWRPGRFFKILMIKSHERSVKSFTAA